MTRNRAEEAARYFMRKVSRYGERADDAASAGD